MSLIDKLRSKFGKSAYTSLAVLAFSAGMPIAYVTFTALPWQPPTGGRY